MWWKTEKDEKEEEKEKKTAAEEWTWGSWWWDQSDWSRDEWWGSASASGSQWNAPPHKAEPTASSTAQSETSKDWMYPKRTVGEDHLALRYAAMSPASFMPQRHVTMALGRPVVVLTGVRSAFGAFGVGCVVLGEG